MSIACQLSASAASPSRAARRRSRGHRGSAGQRGSRAARGRRRQRDDPCPAGLCSVLPCPALPCCSALLGSALVYAPCSVLRCAGRCGWNLGEVAVEDLRRGLERQPVLALHRGHEAAQPPAGLAEPCPRRRMRAAGSADPRQRAQPPPQRFRCRQPARVNQPAGGLDGPGLPPRPPSTGTPPRLQSPRAAAWPGSYDACGGTGSMFRGLARKRLMVSGRTLRKTVSASHPADERDEADVDVLAIAAAAAEGHRDGPARRDARPAADPRHLHHCFVRALRGLERMHLDTCRTLLRPPHFTKMTSVRRFHAGHGAPPRRTRLSQPGVAPCSRRRRTARRG